MMTIFLVLLFSFPSFGFLILDNPNDLQVLEKNGLSFAAQLTGSGSNLSRNSQLSRYSHYSSIAKIIETDLDKLKAGDKYLSVNMSKKHRLFDKRWLRSKHAFYELVGVVNRMDRAPFSQNGNFKCGEMRLIYRLAYRKTHRKEKIYTRLPLTMNVVFWANSKTKSKCTEIAKDWNGNPLQTVMKNRKFFSYANLKSVEINLQAIRWPSTVRPDFGGYAEYILRVFHYDSQKRQFAAALMENMIDVEKIKASFPLRKKLLAHLKDKKVIDLFDKGIGTLPDEFLAKKAVSAAFHGMARLKNRPFDQLFSAKDFAGTNFKQGRFVKTPEAYLRRLNDMTCVGCHQGRAIAGFHFVGVDRKETFAANAVKMARSGHLQLDLKRRKDYFSSLVHGKTPDPERGFSERLESELGQYGAHCSLGTDPSFAKWNCEEGLKCQSVDTALNNTVVGVCLPPKNNRAGDPCDVGRVSQHSNSRKDRVVSKTPRPCRNDQYCFKAGDGFPGGLCHGYCEDLKSNEACGLIAFNGFNSCLFQRRPFTSCLKEFTGKITMRSCNKEKPCRDDFVCSRSEGNAGVCIPPYFLFQLRVDGHPSPT